MLARLASRKAKPAGSYHLRPSDVATFIAPLHIDDLHGFGRASYEKAQEKLGTTSMGELAKMSKAVLCEALGKGTGETLYNAVRGIDYRKLESDKPRKSVSCDINVSLDSVSLFYTHSIHLASTVSASRITSRQRHSYISLRRRSHGNWTTLRCVAAH